MGDADGVGDGTGPAVGALDHSQHRRAEVPDERGVQLEVARAHDPGVIGPVDHDDVAAAEQIVVGLQGAGDQLVRAALGDQVRQVGGTDQLDDVVSAVRPESGPHQVGTIVVGQRDHRPEVADATCGGGQVVDQGQDHERLASGRFEGRDVDAGGHLASWRSADPRI